MTTKPPWGSDEEFDPQKAWDLIQNLRKDIETGKEALKSANAKLATAEAERDTARKELAEAGDATSSESEKLAKQLADMQKDLEAEKASRLRAEVVAAKGLTPAMAKRLSGATREELEADADELLEAFPAASGGAGAPPSQKPRSAGGGGHLTGGGDPTGEAEEKVDPAKLAEAIPLP